jgi:phosphate transport system permease protein
LFRGLCAAAALSVILLAVLLAGVLFSKSALAMRTLGWQFLIETNWDPAEEHHTFGALSLIYGTLTTSAIAMLIAVPLGVGTAAYLSEIAPAWLRRIASFLVEMLATIPSVVYGFWGLFVLAPSLQVFYTWLGGPNTGGVGIFAAGLILSVMIVPYVTAVSYDACRAVPHSQRAGALSLGATRWQVIWSVVLPYARPGIVGGCFLALGRALGETMAVTMLIGNRQEINFSLYALGDSIASLIANQVTEAPYDLYLSAVVALGLVLFLLTMIVNTAARYFIWRIGRVRKFSHADRRLLQVVKVAEKDGEPGRAEPDSPEAGSPPVYERLRSHNGAAQRIDRAMTLVLALCLVTTVGPLFLILAYLVSRGVRALSWDFFTQLPAPVGETGGGMANALVGSLELIGLATALAVPLGILASVYLAEYRSRRLGPAVRFIGELLAGVPSIVIGIFAYSVVVLPMGHFSGWAGSFALAVIMIPIVMRASEEALKMVPTSLRYASYALGSSHWQTVLRVTIPAALPAIITGVFLAIARIGGETAPLLLTAGSNLFWQTSPNDLTPSLPVNIYTYATSPSEDWHELAWAAALVLMIGVMGLNFGIRLATGKRVISASRAE